MRSGSYRGSLTVKRKTAVKQAEDNGARAHSTEEINLLYMCSNFLLMRLLAHEAESYYNSYVAMKLTIHGSDRNGILHRLSTEMGREGYGYLPASEQASPHAGISMKPQRED